jgi:protein involved in polysaccharide export with SLBB domain
MRSALLILALMAAVLTGRAQAPASTTNSAPAVAPTPSYQLSPMDKLTVSVSQDPAAGKPIEISVSPLGDLTIPISRCCEDAVTVSVRGKTVEQAEKEIKERLESEFYQTATVQLRLIDPTRRRGQVLFTGAVRQNAIQLDPGKPKTLYEAFTEAGPTDYANWKKVKVDRAGSPIKTYDMAAVKEGKREKDVELQDGDRIIVEESFFKLR